MLNFLRSLFGPSVQIEVPMTTVEYKVKVITADGFAHLELTKEKETFVPRVDDTIAVTNCVKRPDGGEVEADVYEVVYDPVLEIVTVYAETDLDLADGWKIDCLVESATEDGWQVDGDVEYHGCCKGLCPCDVSGPTEEVRS